MNESGGGVVPWHRQEQLMQSLIVLFVKNTFILIVRKIVCARSPPSPPPLSVPLHRIDASIPGRVQSLVSWTIKYQDNGNSPTAIVFLYCGLRQIGRYLLPIPNLRKTLRVFWNFSLATDEYTTLDQYSDLEAAINISMRYSFFAGSNRQTESSWKRNRIL